MYYLTYLPTFPMQSAPLAIELWDLENRSMLSEHNGSDCMLVHNTTLQACVFHVGLTLFDTVFFSFFKIRMMHYRGVMDNKCSINHRGDKNKA